MNFLMEDKQVRAELKKQMISIIRSAEFSEAFREKFIDAVEKDILKNLDELMDYSWESLQKQCAKAISENFNFSLLPK